MNVTIEDGAIRDTEELTKLGKMYEQWTGKQYNPNYSTNGSIFVVAKDNDSNNDNIVGCIQLIIIEDPFFQRKWGMLENLFVSPNYRKIGLGERLVERAEVVASDLECSFVKLTSNFDKVASHALFKSRNYVEGGSFKRKL